MKLGRRNIQIKASGARPALLAMIAGLLIALSPANAADCRDHQAKGAALSAGVPVVHTVWTDAADYVDVNIVENEQCYCISRQQVALLRRAGTLLSEGISVSVEDLARAADAQPAADFNCAQKILDCPAAETLEALPVEFVTEGRGSLSALGIEFHTYNISNRICRCDTQASAARTALLEKMGPRDSAVSDDEKLAFALPAPDAAGRHFICHSIASEARQ